MKRRSIFSRHPDIVDVHDLRDVSKHRWFKSPRALLALATSLLILAAASWWAYTVYLKPIQDQRRVDEAVTILETTSMAEWLRKTNQRPAEQRLLELAAWFREKDSGIPTDIGLRASRSALDLAIHQGSFEAEIELGKAFRDGDFGDKDAEAALSHFDAVLKKLQPGIKSGDQDALYMYSLMLKEGLGIEPNPKKAQEILKRVALSRDHVTMKRIGTSSLMGKGDERDLELAKAISTRLIATGHTESYWIGTAACEEEHRLPANERAQMQDMVRAGDHANLRFLVAKAIASMEQRKRCESEFLQAAADKGNEEARASLAEISTDTLDTSASIRSRPNTTEQTADPEAQNHTGYLNGTNQIAKGGLSTFKVDNTQAGGDAVVRLYRDGRKPAARSMFVKNGDSFTAEALAPGAYRLRYRYIGSADTFEAEETFTLTETRTETGTRFSRMTVTLYQVANGNMTVKKVDASEF